MAGRTVLHLGPPGPSAAAVEAALHARREELWTLTALAPPWRTAPVREAAGGPPEGLAEAMRALIAGIDLPPARPLILSDAALLGADPRTAAMALVNGVMAGRSDPDIAVVLLQRGDDGLAAALHPFEVIAAPPDPDDPLRPLLAAARLA